MNNLFRWIGNLFHWILKMLDWVLAPFVLVGGLALIIAAIALIVCFFICLPERFQPNSPEDLRNYALIFAAAIGLPLAFWRLNTASRQADTAESGQITDRFSKAVEQLAEHNGGLYKTANLTVRIGGIYSLGRIARDSPGDAQRVFDVLSSYMQAEFPVDSTASIMGPRTLRGDLMAIMKVCQRDLDTRHACVDFRECDLSQVNLQGADLRGSMFALSNLDDANLSNTKVAGASFGGVKNWWTVRGKDTIHDLGKALEVPDDPPEKP